MALIAQSTAPEAVERHYGESLAAVEFLPRRGRVVDLGSGAGFPGLVLAAARLDLEVTLVERREKKAAFLRTAARAMGVDATVSTRSVGGKASLDEAEAVDCLTARAIRFEPPEWERIVSVLVPDGRVLVWSGAQDVEIPGMRVRSVRDLADGTHRRILEFERARNS